jgi:protein tyrosine phosphatase (PTP) superfamily phosphohydrolase (DUF442 family)
VGLRTLQEHRLAAAALNRDVTAVKSLAQQHPAGEVQIRNFRRLDDWIATGGQPTAEEFRELAALGTQAVINLALPTSTYALPDELELVASLGMAYVPIPVVFEAPRAEDFDRFCAELSNHRDQKVFVHCALNYRVSAFVALHRVRHGWDREAAWAEMRTIWEPDEVWARFLADQLARFAQPA